MGKVTGPSAAITSATPTSFGTKETAVSFIDVAACKTPRIKPTNKIMSKIGPHRTNDIQSARTVDSMIKPLSKVNFPLTGIEARYQRGPEECPAVSQYKNN